MINFDDLALDQAEHWPNLLAIVRGAVKPGRDQGRRGGAPEALVALGDKRPALYAAIRPLQRCLVNSQVSKHLVFAFQPTDRVFAHTLYVYPLPDWTPSPSSSPASTSPGRGCCPPR
ncbi:MAG: hypothetical protein IPG96_17735 [Proteobacteria bacterium]|nr:hypothetical protein [Pseudomonadota bacterium]